MAHDYDVQFRFLVWSLSHVIEALRWRQQAVLDRYKLKPVHLSLLLRAGRQGKVRFDELRRDIGLPAYSISRAASGLEERGLGLVKGDASDQRLCWFHINTKGRNLLEVIENSTAKAVLQTIGAVIDEKAQSSDLHDDLSHSSARYYEFTVHLWNLTRFLPEAGCGNAEYYFPTDIAREEWRLPDEDDFRVLVEPLWAKREAPPGKRLTDVD